MHQSNCESPHRFVPGPDAPATLLHPSPVPGAPRLPPGFRYWGTPGKRPGPTYLSGRRTPGTRAAPSRRAAAGGSKSPRPKPRRRRSCASSPGDVPGAGRSARPLSPRVGLRAGGRGKRGAGARRGRARRRGAGPGGVSRPVSPMRLCSRSGVARPASPLAPQPGAREGTRIWGEPSPSPQRNAGLRGRAHPYTLLPANLKSAARSGDRERVGSVASLLSVPKTPGSQLRAPRPAPPSGPAPAGRGCTDLSAPLRGEPRVRGCTGALGPGTGKGKERKDPAATECAQGRARNSRGARGRTRSLMKELRLSPI